MTQEINIELDQYKKYKAYFVGINDQQKKEFKNSKCVMIISVGQKYHEMGEFYAAIALVNKHFGYCNILVCDTLQRHTMNISQQEVSEDELYVLSKTAGDKWIERNMQYISTLTIPYTISRWDAWIENDRYQHYHEQVYELYNNDNQEAWRKLYALLLPKWERFANVRFMEGISCLCLKPSRV